DDSPSNPYLRELAARFPTFIKATQNAAAGGHPASYHIGIVTSDLGAGPEVLNQGQCHPDGDGGKLHVTPASNVGLPAACQNFALAGGVRFIDYDQIAGTDNLMGVPAGDVATAFGCMSGVGSGGCGFEHVLESTYRALHDPPPENAGFLRDDALLVVFYITDEDDCSAPPDTDLFDPSPDGVAKYGTLHSFRCTQWGITCGSPPMPLSPMSMSGRDDCRPLTMAEGGKLFDVQRYIDFFARPGGVKADPSDVILVSINAPPAPVGVSVTMPCADQVNTPSCPILNHSCVAPANPQFFGDPAVRVSAVVDAAVTTQRTSMCETDFSPAVDGLAQKIIARLR
ncbi:MAG: hypothetical protein ACXVDD_18170, partial [Polyangia bacterium]